MKKKLYICPINYIMIDNYEKNACFYSFCQLVTMGLWQ